MRTGALDAAEVQRQLAKTPGWALVNGALQKRFAFADFHGTMAFVNAVAEVAHELDHHPELQLSYGLCTVRFNTHSVAGISMRDFDCAARVDALVHPHG